MIRAFLASLQTLERTSKLWAILYLLGVLALFFYSFTQVDLSLTLTRVTFWKPILDAFQYVGYFNRPLSSVLYIGILLLLFLGYVKLLSEAVKKKVSAKVAMMLVFLTTLILVFSYNAFSYDLFNYIFDAKIVTNYQQNPYEHKALDYPEDPMLSFMRWTHRTYPYGPTWLAFTVPLSYLGFQFFLPTFFLFKIAIAAAYVGAVYFLAKVAKHVGKVSEEVVWIGFGLNPLLVIESLVSGHNDIVMLFLLILAMFLFVRKKPAWSLVAYIFSVGIKFVSGLLLPAIAWFMFQKKKEWERFFEISALLMVVAIIVAIFRTNFQAWYVIYPLPFLALLFGRPYIRIVTTIFTFGAVLIYLPFLYLGTYDPPVPLYFFIILMITCLAAVIALVLHYISRQYK